MIQKATDQATHPVGHAPAGPQGQAMDNNGMALNLKGTTILLVEDEALLALDLQDTLEETGAAVIGPVPSLAGAIQAATDECFDAAILDIDLQGKDVFPAAEILVKRDVPFLFHTGHGKQPELAASFPNVPVFIKPAEPSDLLHALSKLITERRAQ